MKRISLILISCALFSGLVQASSSQAWNEHRQQMLKACLAASQFKDAHARGKPAEFDDQTGMSALLVEGVYPQKHMKQRTGTELCLYDRKQQRAYVSEWSPQTK
ncbi:hypothetical protein ACSFEV_07100 [Pseudomonas fulva]|uniref:hypothetical protein n=1 Tax=Pseudomonas TaxID=286 RepID=UPI0015F76876|nr:MULTISPECIES: hypothetical protein [Pseudomonas putida group]MBA5708823.1 hypothetical protein [Pseudomonas fulva]MBF8660995.1 hypothetical protein [Pseudomonas putida]MBF8728068.1 hypothetical protein [Pseudomonas putida]